MDCRQLMPVVLTTNLGRLVPRKPQYADGRNVLYPSNFFLRSARELTVLTQTL